MWKIKSSWCRDCYFFLLWDSVLCWSGDIPVCDWPSAEALLRLQLQEMGFNHRTQRIPHVHISDDGFESCSPCVCCVHDLASSWHGCLDCSPSFLGWMCGSTRFRGSAWKTRLFVLAHCSNSLWGKQTNLYADLDQFGLVLKSKLWLYAMAGV